MLSPPSTITRTWELVGALVYSDAKAGRDVGAISRIGDIGVTTTKDPAEIVALDADCMLHRTACAQLTDI